MTKILVNCKECNVEFLKNASEVKRTNNHYCSNKCSREHNYKLQKISLEKRKNEYYNNPKKCINCDSIIEFDNKNKNNYCSIKCAAIYTQRNGGHHKWSDEGKRILSSLAKNREHLKQGLYLNCPNCKNSFYVHKKSKQIYCSQNCRNEYVKVHGLLKGKVGGYREKGGRGKQGWYKGYYCNSSWELAWVIFNLEHNIKFKRNTARFPYVYNNKSYNFYPDFILESTNEYFEIKGYLDNKNKAKINSFPFKLNVIDKHKIKMYIDYVTSKYGKDFINLYEK
jgi:hypothetical protein